MKPGDRVAFCGEDCIVVRNLNGRLTLTDEITGKDYQIKDTNLRLVRIR